MTAVRRRGIRTLTKRLLEENQICEPPVDVEVLAKSLGVVIREESAEDNLSGFLLRDIKNYKAVIGVNYKHSDNRKRFTIAHELGHLFLHEGEQIHVDRGIQINLRNEAASQGSLIAEKEANLFAAELLMPAHFIHKYLENKVALDLEKEGIEPLTNEYQVSIEKLAKDYQVSTQAMTFRLAYLKYLTL